MSEITVPDKSTGGELSAAEFNQILDAIKDGTRRIVPQQIVNPDSNGLPFFASDGVTQIATLDDNGNFRIKGRILDQD